MANCLIESSRDWYFLRVTYIYRCTLWRHKVFKVAIVQALPYVLRDCATPQYPQNKNACKSSGSIKINLMIYFYFVFLDFLSDSSLLIIKYHELLTCLSLSNLITLKASATKRLCHECYLQYIF